MVGQPEAASHMGRTVGKQRPKASQQLSYFILNSVQGLAQGKLLPITNAGFPMSINLTANPGGYAPLHPISAGTGPQSWHLLGMSNPSSLPTSDFHSFAKLIFLQYIHVCMYTGTCVHKHTCGGQRTTSEASYGA